MELKKDGKVNAVGVCNFNLSDLNACKGMKFHPIKLNLIFSTERQKIAY